MHECAEHGSAVFMVDDNNGVKSFAVFPTECDIYPRIQITVLNKQKNPGIKKDSNPFGSPAGFERRAVRKPLCSIPDRFATKHETTRYTISFHDGRC